MCILLDISVLIVRFGDWVHACRVDTPTSHQKQTCRPSTEVSWLFDELSDNNASDDGLSLSASVAVNKQILEVILMPGNGAMLVAYQINAPTHSAISIRLALCKINTMQLMIL